jgi:hypothetical protein
MRLVVLTLTLTLACSAAHAQICVGRAPLNQGTLQAGGGVAFTDGANAFSGFFGGGTDRGFGGVSIGRTNFSDFDSSSTDIMGFFGGGNYFTPKVHLCALADVGYSAGPEILFVDTHSVGFGGGISIGVVASETETLAVVPTFGGSVRYHRLTAKFDGESESTSETYGVIEAGLGLILNKRVAITPLISIPVGLDENDLVFSLTVSFNFGR